MARYALVIGISEYQSSNLSRLPKTVTDAEAVGQLLKQYGDFQIVKRLPERWNQQQNDYEIGTKAVTGNELGQALRTFLLEQAYRSDALIYFSGHGITVSDNLGQTKGYLATSDCVLETDGKRIVGQQHGIALDSLNELIRAAELSSLVLLLDCCHGGYFLERQLVEQTLTAFSSQKDYYIITACRTFEQAWAMHDEKHDVFTGAVLDGLALENAGKDGSVSGDRLFDHISRQLKGKRQEPIRMGWGKSITVVNYPPTENIPSATFTFNRENPYQGLQAFELGKEKYFFGRELAIRALLERLNNARFLSVIGRSGCGKSSLVKAGLLPQLKHDRLPGSSQWEIEIFTPGIDPLGKLTEILTRRHQENKPFVLFIDQFEEVFTLCNDEAKRQSFMRLMADEATASDRITRVIVAIRGDFLDRCAAYPEAVNLINRTQPTTYVVELLSHSEIVETIEKPAELHGVGFEPGLVSQIAEDVENQPGALPLLQYALSELWRKFCEQDSPSGQPLLTWKDYEEIGGVKGALDNRATILYRSFIPENQAFVRRLFMRLVKLGDGNEVTRRRATWEELSAIADSPEQLLQVVRLLAGQQQRLIITDENTIEVAHEALLSEWKLLRSWIEEDRDNIRLNQSLEDDCREWLERFNKSDDALLTGARLAAIEEWARDTQPRLSPLQEEFLNKSLERRDRQLKAEIKRIEEQLEQEQKLRKAEKQRIRIALASAWGLAFLAASTLGFGIKAEQNKNKAIQALISDPIQLLEKNYQIEAMIASIQALKDIKEIGAENHDAVNQLQTSVIDKVRESNRLQEHQDAVNSVSFSPDGKTIASASLDQTVKLWRVEGGTPQTLSGHTKGVWRVRYSPSEGNMIASGSIDHTVRLWKADNGEFLRPLIGHTDVVYDLSFSPDSKRIATASWDGTIKIWDTATGKELKTLENLGEQDKINSLDFAGTGQTLASGGYKDGSVKLWDLNTGTSTIIGQHNKQVNCVRFSPSGQFLASSSDDGTIKLWKHGQPLTSIKAHEKFIYGLAFSPDEEMLASVSTDGFIKLWKIDGTQLKTLDTLKGHIGEVYEVNFSSLYKKDHYLIASTGEDHTVRIWKFNISSIIPTKIVKPIDNLQTYSCKFIWNYLQNSNDKLIQEQRNFCKNILL
ncbi:caspase family protein [Coleofasciculus sp. FACHB-64]|uniref:nSTAND1 domain-containing NTPase n=1 Tax=Cyanophyceae TaxID=3028117 RepID=UPI001686BEB7|nr:caspase family protein [Coleofasciculus sp. FACHB-64]MBD2044151.1 caspase family protein [Coleofasciculus sp. FACHB-64]